MDRANWFKVHSWIGFKVSILLCFVLVTGTLAVLSHELDWITNAAMRIDSSETTEMNWVAVYASAQKQTADKPLTSLTKPMDPWFAAEAVYFQEEDKLHRLFFHPSTGGYTGEGRWYNWQRFFRMSHRHLMLPTIVGVTIVGATAILILISLITSLIVYRKWWRGFFRMPRLQHRKVFWGDVHRLFGVWSMWLLIVLSITGIWYLLEVWGLNAPRVERAKAISELAIEQAVMPEVSVFEQMLGQTKTQFPQLDVSKIFFPRKPGDAVLMQGQADAVLVRTRANTISFDPVSGELLSIVKGEELSIHGRISEAADPLHFGTFAGLTSKIVYFLFGLILSGLAISGTYIYGMRISRLGKDEPSPRKKIWLAASADMTWGKWLSILAVSVCLALTIYIFGGFYTV